MIIILQFAVCYRITPTFSNRLYCIWTDRGITRGRTARKYSEFCRSIGSGREIGEDDLSVDDLRPAMEVDNTKTSEEVNSLDIAFSKNTRSLEAED
jgi:hypothetical protein